MPIVSNNLSGVSPYSGDGQLIKNHGDLYTLITVYLSSIHFYPRAELQVLSQFSLYGHMGYALSAANDQCGSADGRGLPLVLWRSGRFTLRQGTAGLYNKTRSQLWCRQKEGNHDHPF